MVKLTDMEYRNRRKARRKQEFEDTPLNAEFRKFLFELIDMGEHNIKKLKVIPSCPSLVFASHRVEISEKIPREILVRIYRPLGIDTVEITTDLTVQNLFKRFRKMLALENYGISIRHKVTPPSL